MSNSEGISKKFMIYAYIGVLLKLISFRLIFTEWKMLTMS